jgi:hypothetical protein
MSAFDDDDFNLEGLKDSPPFSDLEPGGLAEVHQALRVQRLRKRLPHLRERALRVLERLDLQRDMRQGPRGRSDDRGLVSRANYHGVYLL